MATDTRDAAPAPAPATGGRGARVRGDRGNRGRRLTPAQYYREIVSELRKVIYPSRNELLTYVVVVIVFVSVIVAIVAGLDWGFTKAVLAIFG